LLVWTRIRTATRSFASINNGQLTIIKKVLL